MSLTSAGEKARAKVRVAPRLNAVLARELAEIEAQGNRRALIETSPGAAGALVRDGAALLDFSSNDYLGLAQHPALIERAREWTARHGTGAGASRLVTGTMPAHLAIEQRVARMKGTEAALLFATGWQANVSIISALLRAMPGAAVLCDELVHNSMHYGYRAGRAAVVRFRHNDPAHLETLLREQADAPARLILTESVFSMDGDCADLAALSALARDHDAFLFVDEAHATGVLGPGGAGLTAAFPPGTFDCVMGTFSKALGSAGAYVAGSRTLIDYLVNRSAGFIFSTAPPPGTLGAIDAALDLVPAMEAERAHLAALGEDLRERLGALGIETGASTTHIVPAIIGGARETVALGRALAEAGFLAAPIRPPTVPPGTSRIRLALRASHRFEDIDALVAALVAAR